MVAMDTEVLEVDEGTVKQLGLAVPAGGDQHDVYGSAAALSARQHRPGRRAADPVSELLSAHPHPDLSFTAVLNFLIANNKARILEDPRITTVSGRTASLRAGETVNILTTTGGGTGTVATTQVQSFQTGVTLDITPVVNDGDYITVTLHPSVNSIAAISAAGVPNIQTRDTTTTVGLHDGQTIVIAGLIEDIDSRSVQKIPFLGDLPLIGRALFTYQNVQKTRNELIVTVTPHIVRPGESGGIGVDQARHSAPRRACRRCRPTTQLPPPRRVAREPRRSRTTRPPPRREPQPVTVPTPAVRSAVAIRRRPAASPRAKPSPTRIAGTANSGTVAVGVLANQRLHVWSGAAKQLCGIRTPHRRSSTFKSRRRSSRTARR